MKSTLRSLHITTIVLLSVFLAACSKYAAKKV